jgi:hypothetical protein
MKLQGGYRVVAYRSICRLCVSPNALPFSVPDNTWETVVPLKYQNDDLCIDCFENLVCDKQIELFHTVWTHSAIPIKHFEFIDRDLSRPLARLNKPSIRSLSPSRQDFGLSTRFSRRN